jgi:hypothetical protein
MFSDVRAAFRNISIPKPDELFVRLPGAATIFQDLRLYQNSAVMQLLGRGLIAQSKFKQGVVEPDLSSLPQDLRNEAAAKNAADGGLSKFLAGPFSSIPLRGADNLYRKAGLPSRAITA